MSYTDYVITAVIVALMLIAVHRVGQVNPVGTGKLAQRLSAVEAKVAGQGEKIDGLERALGEMATSSADIARGVEAMRFETAGDRAMSERTWLAIDHLQKFFIEDALKRRGQ